MIRVGRIEDIANVIGDLFAHFDFRSVMHRVLRQVKLTALPRNARECCLASCLDSFVGIADDQLHAVDATFLQ